MHVNNRHHVIIGDGLTAAEFAKNVVLTAGDRLTIVGSNSNELGRGLAYRKVSEDHPWHLAFLLNSPAESVDPEFGRWVRDNWDDIAKRMQGRRPNWLAAGERYSKVGDYGALNAPRELFGEYLCSLVDQKISTLRARGVTVNRLDACAMGMDYEVATQQFHISLDSSETLIASQVDVATGGAQVQSLFAADGQYSFSQLYGNEAAIAERVKQGGSVVCLGANAAMLDTLRLCQSVSATLNFCAVSPSGQLPEPLIPSQPRKRAEVSLEPHYASAQSLTAALSCQMDALRRQGYGMAEMRSPFKSAILTAGLESLLSDPKEARKVMGQMERLFLRGTRDSLADFKSLQNDAQVQLIAGRLVDVKPGSNHIVVTIERRDGSCEERPATALINCAGAGRAPRFDTMTEILLDKGWLTRCPISGGLEVGSGLNIGPIGLRYLSPAVTAIGEKALAFSLYDASELRAAVKMS